MRNGSNALKFKFKTSKSCKNYIFSSFDFTQNLSGSKIGQISTKWSLNFIFWKFLEQSAHLRVAMSNTDSNNASKKVQISLALVVPKPLHRSLSDVQRLFVISQKARIKLVLSCLDNLIIAWDRRCQRLRICFSKVPERAIRNLKTRRVLILKVQTPLKSSSIIHIFGKLKLNKPGNLKNTRAKTRYTCL